MMFGAINTAGNGLHVYRTWIDAVSDNISNINTVGFKEQRTIFQDMLGHSITAGSATAMPGSGVMVEKIGCAPNPDCCSGTMKLPENPRQTSRCSACTSAWPPTRCISS